MTREVAALRRWVRNQGIIDAIVGPLILVLPISVWAFIPEPFRPLPNDELAVRMIGLYAAGLAPGWIAGWRDPIANAPAIWASNALRALGAIGIFLGASLDPHMPILLRIVPLGEAIFALRTAHMMKRAGLAWLVPARAP